MESLTAVLATLLGAMVAVVIGAVLYLVVQRRRARSTGRSTAG
jgi:membrane protein YqaA with SNARE-associated domain